MLLSPRDLLRRAGLGILCRRTTEGLRHGTRDRLLDAERGEVAGDLGPTGPTSGPRWRAGTFDNFAFDEVYADAARLDPALDCHIQVMVQLAAILAAGGLAEFRVMAAAALAHGGVSPVELKEIVYHSIAYVGMARAYDYLHAANDVLTDAGVELPLPGQSASTTASRLDHGKSVQGRIVGGDAVAPSLTDTPADEVRFQRYLAANCFGDTVGRRGIDLEVRELLILSMLVALGGADAQVRGHVDGNLEVGNTRERLLAVLTVLMPYIGYPRTLNGLAAINDTTR
jgi:4-carboxymuconolactone decarboxylase